MNPTTPRQPTIRRAGMLLVAAATLALVLPATTLAARPVRTVETAFSTGGRVTTTDGTIMFSAFFSTLSGARGGLAYTGPLGNLQGPEGFAEMTGNRLVGEYFLIDVDTFEPAGFATYVIDFSADGPEVATRRVTRDGNHRSVLDLIEQPMLASGSITMPDGTVFPLDGLEATRFVADQWTTAPEAKILDGSETLVDATWYVDGLPVGFRVNVTELASASVVYVIEPTGEVIGLAQPVFAEDRLVTDFTLRRGDMVVGTASVDLAVVEGATTATFEQGEFSRQRVLTTEITVIGQLTVTLDGVTRTFDFAEVDELFTIRQSWHGLQYPHAEDGEG